MFVNFCTPFCNISSRSAFYAAPFQSPNPPLFPNDLATTPPPPPLHPPPTSLSIALCSLLFVPPTPALPPLACCHCQAEYSFSSRKTRLKALQYSTPPENAWEQTYKMQQQKRQQKTPHALGRQRLGKRQKEENEENKGERERHREQGCEVVVKWPISHKGMGEGD